MVARSTWDGAMTVYRYGCPSWADLDETGMEQLRLGHELRNRLVQIEHRYQAAVDAVWRLFPLIAETEAEAGEAEAAVDAIRERAAQDRRRDRTTVPRARTREELALARQRLRDARAAHRDAKARLYPEAKAHLVDVRQARDAVRKGLYAEFCQRRGLYWATYNDVVQTHDTAVRRVVEARRRGRPAELRLRRWDGSGTITVQLQREAGKPARTFELLCSDVSPWRNVVRFWPEERHRPRHQRQRTASKHWEVALYVGRRRHITLPVVLDRTPRDQADVTLVRVTRRRIAGHHRLSVSLTARIPSLEPPTGATVGVHIGWRSVQHDLRVAVLAFDRSLAPPPDEVPVHELEDCWEVRLPAALHHVHERTDRLRSQRDTDLDVTRAALADWLERHPQRELTADQVRRWRAPRRFARLAVAWRQDPPDGGLQIAEALEAWRRRDRRLWEREANERDQVAARVRDLWAKTAAWLAGQAGLVRVDDIDIETLTRVPRPGNDDPVRARRARAQRQIASPGSLRDAVRRAAQTRAVPIEVVALEGFVFTHAVCGAALTGDRSRSIALWCPSCGRAVDQDVNAARHLVATSRREGLVLAGRSTSTDAASRASGRLSSVESRG